MTPQAKLEQDIKDAMKARAAERLSTLRMLLGAVKNRRIELGDELTEDDFQALVQRSIKQRKESVDQFRAGNREDLAAKEEAEIETLLAYLPAQASEDDVRAAVAEFIASEGLEGPSAIGPIMKAMMAKFGGATDGKTISRIARDLLG